MRATKILPDSNARAEETELAAEWVLRSALKPWDRNPRHNEKAIAKVAASIKRFGFGNPILARKADGEVIAGHTRLLAAETLGLDKVPVRYLDLDPADAHLLALADNKLGEIAEWDDAELASLLSDYGLPDAELAGWDKDELDKLATALGAEGEESAAELGEGLTYAVIVSCTDERDQARTIERLEREGFVCKPLIS
jgi:ParB-like chromosome segregation protein Spo0J